MPDIPNDDCEDEQIDRDLASPPQGNLNKEELNQTE